MTADERGESVAHWLETLADAHDHLAETEMGGNEDQNRMIAIHYRARATDIRAEMDIL